MSHRAYETWGEIVAGGGITRYNLVWPSGDEPPEGLDADGLDAWQKAHEDNIGYAPALWQMMVQGATVDPHTDEGQAQIQQLEATYETPANAVKPTVKSFEANVAPEYLAGGQVFTNAADAAAARAKSDAQVQAGGSANLETLQEGASGFIPGVPEQMAAAKAAAAQAAAGNPSGAQPVQTPVGPRIVPTVANDANGTTTGPVTTASTGTGELLPVGATDAGISTGTKVGLVAAVGFALGKLFKLF